jgi:hypothetical protein
MNLLQKLLPGKIELRRVGDGKVLYVENKGMDFVPKSGERMQVFADLKGNLYQLEEIIPWSKNPGIHEYAAYARNPEGQREIMIKVPDAISSGDFRDGPGITQVKEKESWVYNLRKI